MALPALSLTVATAVCTALEVDSIQDGLSIGLVY